MEDIENTRLENLKEKTLRYRFTIVHVPGVKNKVADATSRYPTSDPDHLDIASMQAGKTEDRLTRELVRSTWQEPTDMDIEDSVDVENIVEATLQATLSSITIGG